MYLYRQKRVVTRQGEATDGTFRSAGSGPLGGSKIMDARDHRSRGRASVRRGLRSEDCASSTGTPRGGSKSATRLASSRCGARPRSVALALASSLGISSHGVLLTFNPRHISDGAGDQNFSGACRARLSLVSVSTSVPPRAHRPASSRRVVPCRRGRAQQPFFWLH
jgi:hypothetical protein